MVSAWRYAFCLSPRAISCAKSPTRNAIARKRPVAFPTGLLQGGEPPPQPDATAKLDSLSDRLMFKLQYFNFGDHQSLVTCHTVDSDGADHAGIRWYELRSTGASCGSATARP